MCEYENSYALNSNSLDDAAMKINKVLEELNVKSKILSCSVLNIFHQIDMGKLTEKDTLNRNYFIGDYDVEFQAKIEYCYDDYEEIIAKIFVITKISYKDEYRYTYIPV